MAEQKDHAPNWEMNQEQVAQALSEVTPLIALPMRSLSEAAGEPATVVGTLMGCCVLALDGGCDREQFLQLCEAVWDVMEAADQLSSGIDAKA